MREENNDVWEHFPKMSDEAINFATNGVLADSKYIFVTAGKVKKAYCTHCNETFELEERIKHNTFGTCEKCKSRCQYKQAGRGRSYLTDRAVFLWFEKSKVNKDIVVASWIHCVRDYREKYENVHTICTREKLYVLEMGGSKSYDIWRWRDMWLEEKKKVTNHVNTNLRRVIAIESVEQAIKNTPFARSGWEKYGMNYWVEYLALYSEKPNIEALTKGGHKSIVETKMSGNKTYRAINWNAKKLHEFFKISKNDYKMIKNAEVQGTYVLYAPNELLGLHLWQRVRKEESQIKYQDLMAACDVLNIDVYLEEFNMLRKYTSMAKIISYVKKQFRIDSKRYARISQVLVTWRDYLNDCGTLGIEIDRRNLFPKNLLDRHDQTMKMVRNKKDELLNLEIKKRYDKLKHLTFEHNGLIIKPPTEFNEIIHEGRVLNHCVGGYAERHGKGQTTILFIRRMSDLETPYFTVEIRRGNVVQVEGKKVKGIREFATKEIDGFMKVFKETKLKNQKGSVAV